MRKLETGFMAVALLCAGSGCATVASGSYGHPIDEMGTVYDSHRTLSGLEISARELGGMASEHFGYVEVTFENKTDHWVRIERMNLGFGDTNKEKSVFVPWGRDLESWQLAINERNAVRRTNEETALGLTAAGGAALASSSSDRGVKAVGGLIAVAALTTAFAKEMNDRVSDATDARPFPETHLLNVPIAVPPGLFASRWIVLNTQSDQACLRSMIVDYDVAGGSRERVLLELRRGGSEWQHAACKVGSRRKRR